MDIQNGIGVQAYTAGGVNGIQLDDGSGGDSIWWNT